MTMDFGIKLSILEKLDFLFSYETKNVSKCLTRTLPPLFSLIIEL